MSKIPKLSLKRFGLKLALIAFLALPELAGANIFIFHLTGDVLAGFRKTGANEGKYELVVNLGNLTNFIVLPVGTTITITNFSPSQLTNAFADTASEGIFSYIQWSVFSSFPIDPWNSDVGSFPGDTIWLTYPSTNASTQSPVPDRLSANSQQIVEDAMQGVGTGAKDISNDLGTISVSNNTYLVQEPVSYNSLYLTAFIGDSSDNTYGNFGYSGDAALPFSVENVTPNPFSSAQRDDFYQLVPTGETDPINGSLTNTYYIGYFLLYPDGSMTFTRSAQSSVVAPMASFTGGPTNGFAGFTANFTNDSTGTITNYIWNFGDGTLLTNTDGSTVTHDYATGGDYTVTLTVEGPGGVSVQTQASFIAVSPLPILIAKSGVIAGQFVLSGTNGPAGVQYRILNSTNIALTVASWSPVTTNVFNLDGTFYYTNPPGGKAGFFRLVSP